MKELIYFNLKCSSQRFEHELETNFNNDSYLFYDQKIISIITLVKVSRHIIKKPPIVRLKSFCDRIIIIISITVDLRSEISSHVV